MGAIDIPNLVGFPGINSFNPAFINWIKALSLACIYLSQNLLSP